MRRAVAAKQKLLGPGRERRGPRGKRQRSAEQLKSVLPLDQESRLSVTPMTRISATQDGRATETTTRHYERFARGGFGTVVRFSFW